MHTLVVGASAAVSPAAVLDWIVTLHPLHAASLALAAVSLSGTLVYAWWHHTGRCHNASPAATLNERNVREVEEARR